MTLSQIQTGESSGKPQSIDTANLVGRINAAHRKAELSARDAIQHALEAGGLLRQVKNSLQHGQWLPWLGENFKGSNKTAERYLRLHDHRDLISNSTRASDLSIRQAERLLTVAKPVVSKPVEPTIILPDLDHYLLWLREGSQYGFAAIVPYQPDPAYFFYGFSEDDSFGGSSICGNKRAILGTEIQRAWTKIMPPWIQATEPMEGLIGDGWPVPAKWDFNGFLFQSREEWLERRAAELRGAA